MGAGGRRASRRLKSAPPALRALSPSHPLLARLLAVAYAVMLALLLLSVDQIAFAQSEGPWLQVLGGTLFTAFALSAAIFAWSGLRRRREGLRERALAWGAASLGAGVLGLLSLYLLIQVADVLSLVNGADVHLTKPVIQALPRPKDAKLQGEHPGPAQTEAIYDDFSTPNLAEVAPFYRSALASAGWKEETADAAGPAGGILTLNFDKGSFVASVSYDQSQAPHNFSVTVERLPAQLQQSPSPT